METREFSKNAVIMLIIVGIITLVGNRIGYHIGIVEAIPGMVLIIAIGLVSLLLGRMIPLEIPAFAYATIIGFLLAVPYSSVQDVVLQYVGEINFLATTTPILAYAGLSIGLQTASMKKVSWKLVVVAFLVFTGAFFGAAIIAHIVLDFQGLI